MSNGDLSKLIMGLERSINVLKTLLIIRYLYDGDFVEYASRERSITKMMSYLWQKVWDHDG